MAIIDTDPQGTVNNINTHLDNIDKKLRAIVDKQKPLIITVESETLKSLEKDLIDATDKQIEKIQQSVQIPKDVLIKKLRVFPNVNMVAGFMAQIVHKNTEGQIVHYGDVIVSSNKLLYFSTGFYKDPSRGYSWKRVGFKPEVEIVDAVGDGMTFAFLEKSKKILYRTGLTGQIGTSKDIFYIYPHKHTFKSPILKMMTGRITRHADSNNIPYNHRSLIVVITEDGKVHTVGTNKTGELGINDTSINYTEEFKEITLPNNAKAFDGAIGFAGRSGSICILAKEGGKNVAYVWGFNGKGWLGTGNTNTVLEPKKIYYENQQFYKAWFVTGTIGHGNSANDNDIMQLFCAVGENENDTFLVGAGYNGQNQITKENSTSYSSFQKCYVLGNTTQPIKKPKRVTGYPQDSLIGVITEEGDFYISGKSYGELTPNHQAGQSTFQTFKAGAKFHDAWVLMDGNPTKSPSQSSNKVNIVLISQSKNAVYQAGWDHVLNQAVGTAAGYDEIYNDDWLDIPNASFCFSSNNILNDYTGIAVYTVDKSGEFVMFRGEAGHHLPVPASAIGFCPVYSLSLGAFNTY